MKYEYEYDQRTILKNPGWTTGLRAEEVELRAERPSGGQQEEEEEEEEERRR